MEWLYLVAPGLAWAVAQGAKQLFYRYNKRRKVLDSPTPNKFILPSGGMPSAHSATVIALLIAVGLREGITSVAFGITFWVAAIVVYDAIMVRYASGQQGDALNRLIDEQKSKVIKPRVAHGHTLPEVTVGAAIGAVVTFVVFMATK